MNWELSDVQAGFRKGRGTRDQIENIHWITENYDQPTQHIKKQKQTWLCQQSYGFSRSHVWMWELDHKEDWALKNWWFWIVVLGKILESPLDCMEIKPVSPKGNQPWIFTGRTDAEAEAPILWPPNVKSQFIRKDPDAGKDWRQEEKGITEDEIIRWHHQLNGHEFKQTLGDSGEQRSLSCCSPWGCRVRHDWKTIF